MLNLKKLFIFATSCTTLISRRFVGQTMSHQKSNSNSGTHANHDKKQWITMCRNTLYEMEKRNIRRRAKYWTELVNKQVRDINCRLALDETLLQCTLPSFAYKLSDEDMQKHLSFIVSWDGLKTRQVQNAPKTYVELESKAKNWLNGRRAPNYGSTLFPDMIKQSEIYAESLSRLVFANNADFSKRYCRTCIVGFLSALCSARISLNDASKKAYLICENSIKTGRTLVAKMLQRYAGDQQTDKFPSHLREAADFYDKKYNELVRDFAISINQQQREGKSSVKDDKSECSHFTKTEHKNCGPKLLPDYGGEPSEAYIQLQEILQCQQNVNTVSLTNEQYGRLTQFLSAIVTHQKTQEYTIDNLSGRVQRLEAHQQQQQQHQHQHPQPKLGAVQSNSPQSSTSALQTVPVLPLPAQYPCLNVANANTYNFGITFQQPQLQTQPMPSLSSISEQSRTSISNTSASRTTTSLLSSAMVPPLPNGCFNAPHIAIPNLGCHALMTSCMAPPMNDNRRNNNNNNNRNIQLQHGNSLQPSFQLPSPLKPSNTLNGLGGGLPSTSLFGGVGSYDSNDAMMFGYCQNVSFNSSDAGMTNVLSAPNQLQPQFAPDPNGLNLHSLPTINPMCSNMG